METGSERGSEEGERRRKWWAEQKVLCARAHGFNFWILTQTLQRHIVREMNNEFGGVGFWCWVLVSERPLSVFQTCAPFALPCRAAAVFRIPSDIFL